MHSPAMNNCVAVAGSVAPQSGPKVSQVLSLINGKSVCALVDSGSTVTIIHPDIFPEDLQWFSTARPLITVTGDRSTMLGHCRVNIQLGEQIFPYSVWVAEIHEECLLGFDFMKDTSAVLNVGQRTVTFMDGPPLPLICDDDLSESVQAPSMSDKPLPDTDTRASPAELCPDFLESRIEHVVQPEPSDGIPSEVPPPLSVEPEAYSQEPTALPCVGIVWDEDQSGLIPLSTGEVPSPEHLPQQSSLDLQPCLTGELATNKAAVSGSVTCGTSQNPPTQESVIKSVMENNREGMSTKQQQQLWELLYEFPSVFATSPSDLDRTHLIQHEIDT